MPLIETKGAASAQGFGEFAKVGAATYIEDVFSTYLYTGNSTTGGTQTITNNIDLSTKGGMVWIKGRSAASNHILTDTTRGAGTSATNNQALASNLTSAEDLGGSSYDYLSSFSTTGFVVTQGGTTTATRGTNYNNVTYASWTFRKQPKFFDIVTYTATSTGAVTLSHNLGSTPGAIIRKITSDTGDWFVWHRSLTSGNLLYLNLTLGEDPSSGISNPTSTTFTTSLVSGQSYVFYLFAHDAGGFGLTGTDNVITCGSMDGADGTTVTLGYEPQYIMYKAATTTGNWVIVDNMRGMTADGGDNTLTANTSNAEGGPTTILAPNATGFSVKSNLTSGQTYIYIAIRRGPMKTPTDATKVFTPTVYTGTNVDNRLVDTTIAPDMVFVRQRDDAVLSGMVVGDRLRGQPYLLTGSELKEVNDADAFDKQLVSAVEYGTAFSAMNGFWCGNDAVAKLNVNTTSDNHIAEAFKRAPGFFDVVCYSGTGANRTVSHNLGVVPELILVKDRSATGNWQVYSSALGNTKFLVLNTIASNSTNTAVWNSTTPTASVFSLGTAITVNASTDTYVAYLFASCPGVSKVGSYTGTGTTKQIDCGFTGGARFVLIKRTDSNGDWYVWDSARGIVAGNDPFLELNSADAEVTNTDYVDTYSAGFEITSTAPAGVNDLGGTFIFLAIA